MTDDNGFRGGQGHDADNIYETGACLLLLIGALCGALTVAFVLWAVSPAPLI